VRCNSEIPHYLLLFYLHSFRYVICSPDFYFVTDMNFVREMRDWKVTLIFSISQRWLASKSLQWRWPFSTLPQPVDLHLSTYLIVCKISTASVVCRERQLVIFLYRKCAHIDESDCSSWLFIARNEICKTWRHKLGCQCANYCESELRCWWWLAGRAWANYCEVVSNMNSAEIQVIKLSISVGNNWHSYRRFSKRSLV